jgi:transglutaminase-like putative cysteine protease
VSAISAASVNQTNISNTSVGVINNASSTGNGSSSLNKTVAAGTPVLIKTPVLINGLTLAQMKDGLTRVKAFYVKNGRLPNYVIYGSRHIPITTFEKNIETQGLSVTVTPDTSSVSALAKSLNIGSTSSYNTAVRIFNWVRDNLDYTFYYNTKYGAAGTLKQRTGNCADTSNLLIALARNVGITSRYIHGTCQFSSGTWYGHVWAQLLVNGKWYDADAISDGNSFGVIKNWNTTTYKLNGIYNTLPF